VSDTDNAGTDTPQEVTPEAPQTVPAEQVVEESRQDEVPTPTADDPTLTTDPSVAGHEPVETSAPTTPDASEQTETD
jgi:hypothetical protein